MNTLAQRVFHCGLPALVHLSRPFHPAPSPGGWPASFRANVTKGLKAKLFEFLPQLIPESRDLSCRWAGYDIREVALLAEMKGPSLLQNVPTRLLRNHIKGLPATARPFQLWGKWAH